MSKSSDKKTTFGLDEAQIGRLLQLGSDPVAEPSTDNQADSEKSSSTSENGSPLTPAELPQIKGYDILAKLGEAGQGQVWRALQLSTGREVALKVPRIGSLVSDRTRMRFEREVELAARLKHPRIARLLDSGIHQGQYYYVMDLIEGTNLDQYVQTKNLGQTAILKLIFEICQAVQHAHQKGIIHRDLKPSNIIVTEDGVPYLVDFGLAKEILQENRTPDVSLDGETLGTPAYMSPEQAAGHAEQVDTRTDVYSLGVILFHLLTGQLPHDLSGSRYDVLKRIAEGETKRPRRVNPRLDKDLEILLLKALDREPDRRYASAGGLAQDIENYLTDAPLIAGPPTTLYRFKKFVRRNAVLSAAVLAVAVSLLLGLAATTTMYLRSERAFTKAKTITDFLTKDVLGSVSDANANEQTVSFVLDAASKKLDEGIFKERPGVEAHIRNTLGWTYKRIGQLATAEQQFDRALQINEKLWGKEHYYTGNTRMALSFVYQAQNRWTDAYRIWTGRSQIGSEIGGITTGTIYKNVGKYQEAEACFLNKIERHYQLGRTGVPGVASHHLADVYRLQGRYDEAEKLYLKLREALDRNPEDHGELSRAAALARVYRDQGRYREAEQLYKTTIEKQQRVWGAETAMGTMVDLAQLYTDQGRYDLADELFREVHEIIAKREKPPGPTWYVYNLAVLRTKQGRFSEAETLLKEVQEEYKRRLAEFADDHPNMLKVINGFGVLRREQKNYEEAESLLHQALEGRQTKLGNDHPACFESMHELAVLYKEQARYEEAEKLLLEAVEGRRKLGDTHPHTLESRNNLINLYEAWNKPDKAKDWRAKLPPEQLTQQQ